MTDTLTNCPRTQTRWSVARGGKWWQVHPAGRGTGAARRGHRRARRAICEERDLLGHVGEGSGREPPDLPSDSRTGWGAQAGLAGRGRMRVGGDVRWREGDGKGGRGEPRMVRGEASTRRRSEAGVNCGSRFFHRCIAEVQPRAEAEGRRTERIPRRVVFPHPLGPASLRGGRLVGGKPGARGTSDAAQR